MIQYSNNLNDNYQNAIFGVGILVINCGYLVVAFLTLVASVVSELEAALSSLVLQSCLFLLSFHPLFLLCFSFGLQCNAEQDKCYVTRTL